jgi:predicted nuclease with TOPRIM domain
MLQIELHVEYMKAQKLIGQLLYKLGKQTKEKKVYKEEVENMRARINELEQENKVLKDMYQLEKENQILKDRYNKLTS